VNIFDLHRDVLADDRDFVRSFLAIGDDIGSSWTRR